MSDPVTVLPADFERAAMIVESEPVLSTYAACEWDELSEDGRVWLAKIVREASLAAEQAGYERAEREIVGWIRGFEPDGRDGKDAAVQAVRDEQIADAIEALAHRKDEA